MALRCHVIGENAAAGDADAQPDQVQAQYVKRHNCGADAWWYQFLHRRKSRSVKKPQLNKAQKNAQIEKILSARTRR